MSIISSQRRNEATGRKIELLRDLINPIELRIKDQCEIISLLKSKCEKNIFEESKNKSKRAQEQVEIPNNMRDGKGTQVNSKLQSVSYASMTKSSSISRTAKNATTYDKSNVNDSHQLTYIDFTEIVIPKSNKKEREFPASAGGVGNNEELTKYKQVTSSHTASSHSNSKTKLGQGNSDTRRKHQS
ncbi:hypothetical protein HHI36_023704 [Cryptolaemus montrouzieri]|uniref:Uncharacterized protein n=1 Tax=Cryptolaemus montrouzieri TaxID=559131 RepID=A0ABD2PHD2_9CUCU